MRPGLTSVCALLLTSTGCSVEARSDAGSELADVPTPLDASAGLEADSYTVDAPRVNAVSEDAAPETTDLVCTGRPIPDGLSCVVQEPHLASRCGASGGVVFDGSHCVPSRGTSCGDTERGAFDSLEECGVTCAAAGHCDILALFIPPEWQSPPQFCGEQLYECELMGLTYYDRVSADCTVWGPFSTGAVLSSTAPFPDQWALLYSLTLARPTLGSVSCGIRR